MLMRLVAAALLVLSVGCGREPAAPLDATPPNVPPALDWFTDRAAESGLIFTHVNGTVGKFYYAELIGPGAALFDYDNDGDLDAYLVQGGPLDAAGPNGRTRPTRTEAPQAGTASAGGRLFRNDLTVAADGARTLHFTDVTDASRIDTRGYGMGAATGDFDNDGCIDLYLTFLGPNRLLRNNCDGTFTDVSRTSHTDDPAWSVSAAFLDYDRDGWLDLFVGNYLAWRVESSAPCLSPSGRPDYCSPNAYQPQRSTLYHNNHDGTFTDVTASAGLAHDFGPALGVTTADYNGDGWIDLYVANDGAPNQLWMNQRNGTLTNLGLLSGTALSSHGKPKAGMGVDAGDIDNDGDEDLFVTNLTGEGNDLYVNDGSGLFEEQSGRSGLGPASRGYTGFGAAWLDIDNDGTLDTLIANGAVQTIEALRRANDPFPLHQRKLLFRGVGGGRFEDATARGGKAFELSEVGRGVAFGDIDNDGDADALVANNNGQPRLLVNNVGHRQHWLGLRLVDGARPRDMLGARVGVELRGGATIWRRARTDGSYASASDPRVLVGLGSATDVARVRVVWPDGSLEERTGIAIDRYTTLSRGERR